MLILDVIEHETIWGGTRLSQSSFAKKKIGHLYSLITEDKMASRIINGIHAGETFRDYFRENKTCLGMMEYNEFPFVVALVEAGDNLSIQVHPDDNMAYALDSIRYGKNESWFFLDVPKSGWIYNGCSCKSKIELRDKIKMLDLCDLTDSLSVESGDYVYIEAGTLHALSRGSLVYEIEENCNLTYRFYDFDRKDDEGRLRELHIEKAFQSIDVTKKSVTRKYIENESIEERRYSTQLLKNLTSYKNTGRELACITLIGGSLLADGVNVTPGMSVLLLPGEYVDGYIGTAIVARPRLI